MPPVQSFLAEMQQEASLLHQLVRSQQLAHRRALYLQRLDQARRKLSTLIGLLKPPRKPADGLSEGQAARAAVAVELTLSAIERAWVHFRHLFVQTFFMPFALSAMAILARLAKLLASQHQDLTKKLHTSTGAAAMQKAHEESASFARPALLALESAAAGADSALSRVFGGRARSQSTQHEDQGAEGKQRDSPPLARRELSETALSLTFTMDTAPGQDSLLSTKDSPPSEAAEGSDAEDLGEAVVEDTIAHSSSAEVGERVCPRSDLQPQEGPAAASPGASEMSSDKAEVLFLGDATSGSATLVGEAMFQANPTAVPILSAQDDSVPTRLLPASCFGAAAPDAADLVRSTSCGTGRNPSYFARQFNRTSRKPRFRYRDMFELTRVTPKKRKSPASSHSREACQRSIRPSHGDTAK